MCYGVYYCFYLQDIACSMSVCLATQLVLCSISIVQRSVRNVCSCLLSEQL